MHPATPRCLQIPAFVAAAIIATAAQHGCATNGGRGNAATSPHSSPAATLESATAPTTSLDVQQWTNDPDFAAAAAILPEMQLAQRPEEWCPGDTVLVGLRFFTKGQTTVRLLKIELTDRASGGRFEWTDSLPTAGGGYRRSKNVTALATTTITLYDQQGEKLDTAHGGFGIKLLGAGLFDGTWPMADQQDSPEFAEKVAAWPEDQQRRLSRGWASLMAFSGSLGKPGMFKGLMESIVKRPSLISMVFDRSLSLRAEGMPASGPMWLLPDGRQLPSVRTRLALRFSSKPVLMGDITAMSPVAPLSLCGGVLWADAFRPDDPTQRVEIRLLGARLGSGNPAGLLLADKLDDGTFVIEDDPELGGVRVQQRNKTTGEPGGKSVE